MNAAAPKPVPYQPTVPAQIRPDVSLPLDRREDSRPGSNGYVGIVRLGLGMSSARVRLGLALALG